MAFSILDYTGDGIIKDFNVTFDYLDQSHVVARINKVFTTDGASGFNQEFINSTTLRVTKKISGDPPDNGDEVTILRQTPIATPAVVFGGGSSLSSTNLNKNSEYLTYALQEATDANDAFTKVYLGAFAVDPTLDNDGDALQTGAIYFNTGDSNVYYYTGSTWKVGDIAGIVAASAAAAAASETAAGLSETAAALSETNAAASLDEFTDLYLGDYATEPTVDNDGDPLQVGALFYDTAVAGMKVYNGSAWAITFADPALYVAKAGDTMTGGLTVTGGDFAVETTSPIIKFLETDQAEANQGSFIYTTGGVVSIGSYAGPGYTNASLLAKFDRDGGLGGTTSVVNRANGDLRYIQSAGDTMTGVLTSTAGVNRDGSRDSAGMSIVNFRPTLLLKDTSTNSADAVMQLNSGVVHYYSITAATDDETTGTLSARIDAAGVSVPTAQTVVTREKGDGRYIQVGTPTGGGLFKGDNGEVGTGSGDIFRINNKILTASVTIDATENANATGPLEVDTGVTITVTSGGTLAII